MKQLMFWLAIGVMLTGFGASIPFTEAQTNGAPVLLSATAESSTTVLLMWTDASGQMTVYVIDDSLQNLNNGTFYTTNFTCPSNACWTSSGIDYAVATSLYPDSQYTFDVVDSVGISNSAGAITPLPPPTPPSASRSTAGSDVEAIAVIGASIVVVLGVIGMVAVRRRKE